MSAEIEALRAEIADLRAQLDPLVSWQAVAEALGVSDDTLQRWRRRTGDRTPPVFANREAVFRWWRRVRYGATRERPVRSARVASSGPTLAELEAEQRRRRK